MIIDTSSLPRYRSHKLVWALEIGEGITVNSDSSAVLPIVGLGMEPVTVDAKVIHRYVPMPGDFLVYYADGYQSISPRKAFLEGYTRDDDSEPKKDGTEPEYRRYQMLSLAVDVARHRENVDILDMAAKFDAYVKG